MKTITLDYETYQAELIEAKKQGFEVQYDLIEKLKNILRILDSGEYGPLQKGRMEVFKLLMELDRVSE